jgi:uncharacterized repeat protein (TIGR03943 family)
MSSGRIIVWLIGVTLMRLSISGQYKHYVRVSSGKWLLLAGATLLVLVLADLIMDRVHPKREDGHHGHHGHDHGRIPRLAWLLLLPIAIAFVVAPPALGQWGIDASSNRAARTRRGGNFTRLPPSSQPRPMALSEFVARAYDGTGKSLEGVTVEFEGFVVQPDMSSLTIARYSIACCAADAVASQVHIRTGKDISPDLTLTRDAWVRVTGRFAGLDDKDIPMVDAVVIVAISAPANTYEG